MHLLHRSSVFGGGGRAPRRGGAGTPRAPPARQHQLFSKSDSIKKRSGAAAKGSKRARLRAGLAAALQELRLAGRHKRGSSVSASAATRTTQPGSDQAVACRAAGDPAGPPCATVTSSSSQGTPPNDGSGGGALLLLLLALVCMVALGRAPAICCCTCAAWCCRRRSAAAGGHRQAPPPERRALQ